MKLWHISRTDQCGYDEYDSFVCVAENEEAARLTHPSGSPYSWIDGVWRRAAGWTDSTWQAPGLVKVEEIGTAKDGLSGVICASFNAG